MTILIMATAIFTGTASVSADNSTGNATVNSVECSVGSIVNYTAYLQFPEKIEDIQCTLKYSSEGLKLQSYNFSKELNKGSFFYNTKLDGAIKYNDISFANPMDFTQSDALISVDFKVTAEGDWSIEHAIEVLDTVGGVTYSDTNSKHKSLVDFVSSITTTTRYTVKYNANGGTNAPSTQYKIPNLTLELSSAVPTRTGYKFLGWATSKNSKTVAYKAGAKYTDEKDITLYAVWQAKKTQSITGVKSAYTKALGNKAFTLKAKSKGGKLTYTSSDKKVATVNSKGKVTLKSVGKATITIKASETASYKSAVKKVTIKVNPAGVKASSVKVKANSNHTLAINWSKSKGVTGYNVQYSLKKNFTSAKSVKVSSGKTSATIKGVKKGKTYYVRVRTYKTVKGTKYYSSWTVKSLKAK